MSSSQRIGLGNAVEKKTPVFHGGIASRDAYGRISDLATVWLKETHRISAKQAGDLRVLIQALMEFGFPERNPATGHLELAMENDRLYLALRFANFIVDVEDDPEKTLVQYWLKSDESALLKRILHHQDLVEVRFLKSINIIEWRIVRSLNESVLDFDAQTFRVLIDSEQGLPNQHETFVDMGDLDYEKWLAEIYQGGKNGMTGELFLNGESIQNEQEWARLTVERERRTVDERIAKMMNGDSQGPDADSIRVAMERVRQYEELLLKKEKSNLKHAGEIARLRGMADRNSNESLLKTNAASVEGQEKSIEGMDAGAVGDDAKLARVFREKAMQMYEMAKGLQADKLLLQKELFALRRSQIQDDGENESSSGSMVNMQMDDLLKKVDRLSRALEAEKQKVKMLSDRVTVAEKEAQSAAPLIEDLEAKVETTLKSSQQYKKETELVKQKLVQAEAEKNKIKNELLKAQAQIQTLNKRLAG